VTAEQVARNHGMSLAMAEAWLKYAATAQPEGFWPCICERGGKVNSACSEHGVTAF
jgi:hypothetical protein